MSFDQRQALPPCSYTPPLSTPSSAPVSTFCTKLEVEDPINNLLSFSSLSISPPQTLPTEMEIDEEPSSFSFSSQTSQNPFSLEKCGFRRSSRSSCRPKDLLAGESTQKRRRRRNNKAQTETKPKPHRSGGSRVGKAKYQNQQPQGSEKPKPKGQQRKQQPRQPRQKRDPKRVEVKEDKPINPLLIPFAWGKGQGQRR
ncbi:hypothetical protein CI238_11102 [Colletotrichum incanum]|uniref:Uncharacterized protein n=1 Tax=Colletotrichum incanum TaxID=1573173 RepID=A0A161W2G9_COLIC|nr:hypothetical protein CI238_11102 [Colletotrichum incanum]OHX00007.1 hypothetical protein CSPAE12_01236 [Colletotrichum incanum]